MAGPMRRRQSAGMTTRCLHALGFVALLLLASCLEFDAQAITIRYDEAADRIDVHLVYRGVYAEGDGRAVDEAIRQIEEIRRDGTFALWQNWPFKITIPGEHTLPMQALLAHVDVENGGFFTDPTDTLCAHQYVRIRDAKAFVQQLNSLLDVWVATQLTTGAEVGKETHRWDADTRDFVREFARSGEHLLAVSKGRIELRLPLSGKDHAWLRGVTFEALAEAAAKDAVRRDVVGQRRADGGSTTEVGIVDAATTVWTKRAAAERIPATAPMRFLADNDWSMTREPERTRIALGVAGQRDLVLTKAADGLYHPTLLVALREEKVAIEDNVPDQELARRFQAFTERAAVLPPGVAAMRAGKAPAATGK
jgi:hypothetical protein